MDGVRRSSCNLPFADATSSVFSWCALAGEMTSKAELLRSDRLRSLPLSSVGVTRSVSIVLLLGCDGPSTSVSSDVDLSRLPLREIGRGDSVFDLVSMSTSSVTAAEASGIALAGSGDDESLSICISSKPSLLDRQPDVDARNSSGHEELCDRGSSGGGLLDGVGMVTLVMSDGYRMSCGTAARDRRVRR